MDDNLDLFGRDSDSDSASSEASTTENAPFPGGGAAGGFQGQIQGAIVKLPEAGKRHRRSAGSGGTGRRIG